NPFECSICTHRYDEQKRRARMLPCFHYFCQDCLDQIIKSATPHCPTCRAVISSHSAEMLPPNILKDYLISKMKTGFNAMNLEGSDEDFSAGLCPKHKKCQLYFTCKTHNVKICRDYTFDNHHPSKCQVISFEDEIEETKKKNIAYLKTSKISRNKTISDLQKFIYESRAEMQEQKAEIAKLQKKLRENEQGVKHANEYIERCMENKNKIENIQQKLISSQTINEIHHSCQEAERIIKVSHSIGISLEINYKTVFSKPYQVLIDQ
ncbi:unnamed protein product, partial [Meganyctiphanes norvegica]